MHKLYNYDGFYFGYLQGRMITVAENARQSKKSPH